MRKPRTLPAIKDQLHYPTDANGAFHIRRSYGSGVVVLDFGKGTRDLVNRSSTRSSHDVHHGDGKTSLSMTFPAVRTV